jgi:DNA-binding phage protein
MVMRREHNVSTVARQFQIQGEFISAEPYGNGHINDTYRVFTALQFDLLLWRILI